MRHVEEHAEGREGGRRTEDLFVCIFGILLSAVVMSGCWKSPDYPDSASVKGEESSSRSQANSRSQAEPSSVTGKSSDEARQSSAEKERQSGSQNPETEALSPEEIYRRVKPSLVLIRARVERGAQIGSGFLVGAGLIVTNQHVIEGASQILVESLGESDRSQVRARPAVTHPTVDLAVLNSKLTGEGLPLGEFDRVEVGESVFVVGNPEGLQATFSKGIVSAVRSREEASVLQITAPVSEGSSGGPVLNEQGKVIGVVYAVRPQGQNLNFAVPISYVRDALRMKERR